MDNKQKPSTPPVRPPKPIIEDKGLPPVQQTRPMPPVKPPKK